MGRPAVLKIDIVADAKGVKRGTDQAESRLSKLGGTAAKFGKVAALGLVGVGVAAVAVGKQVVDAASEQQQAFGALGSVYGKNAKQVQRWAAGAATSVGLTKTEYSNLSALIGSQLTNMGRSQAQAAKQSDGLIKSGADLAATFGGSTKDAVEALSSALKGEFDPMERYGVSIKQSDISARLAAQGQDKLTGSAKRTATASATLALIQKQTAAAHGQFSRETNTLAGQQERLKAQLGNVKATVGTALLPVLTRLFSLANAKLFPALKIGGAWLQQHVGPAFAAVGRFIQNTVLPAMTRLGGFVRGTLVPILGRTLAPVLAGARAAFANVQAAVQRNRPQLEAIGRVLGTVGKKVGELIVWLAQKLGPVIGKIIGTQFKVLGTVLGGLTDGVGAFVTGIQHAVTWVQNLWDKLDRLAHKVGSIHLPDLNPFGAAGVVGMVPSLAGGGPAYGGPAGLARASLSSPVTAAALLGGGGRGGGVVIDRRDFRTIINVDGALDGPAVARQLQSILTDQSVRQGRATSYGVPA